MCPDLIRRLHFQQTLNKPLAADHVCRTVASRDAEICCIDLQEAMYLTVGTADSGWIYRLDGKSQL